MHCPEAVSDIFMQREEKLSAMANLNRRRSSPSADGQQSLLTAINRFVQAVDLMDDTVMIPCRLRDIPVESIPVPYLQEENNNKAVVPSIPVSGDLYHFYAMLHAIRSEIIAGPTPHVDDDQSDNTDDSVDETTLSAIMLKRLQQLSGTISEVCLDSYTR
ncbi:hypothetical protein Btru_023312 [Bulinus truncatus]|nr:hypothetical protein Btru_023312 [Bulinus truncatus]